MKSNSRNAFNKKNTTQKYEMDKFLEEYTSKLEQKFVSQTQQLKTITDNAESSLFLIDNQGKPTYMNPAAEKTTGYKLSEVYNKKLHDVLHYIRPDGSKNPTKGCPILYAVRSLKNVKDQEDFFIRKDGSFFQASYSVSPLEEKGKPKGAVVEYQDITKRKELERQKDEFIGVASHELKTPVTSIKAYTQVLNLRFKKSGDRESSQLVEKMDGQLDRLTNLIADLLDVTKMEGGLLIFHEGYFNFSKLVEEIVEEIQRTTEKHDILLRLSKSKMIYADRDRVGQVITNFLTNAIKYSPKSKKVIVTSSVKNGNVELAVKDFGVGISKAKKDKVFERFYRISGPKEDTYPGLGLGLYISSEIIKRMGGRIWVESAKGKGSTFYFSLPIKKTKNKTTKH